MPNFVYFNGEFLLEEEARIPLLDRVYLYGEGLFETLKATDSWIHFFSEHWERLKNGAKILDFKIPLTESELQARLQECIERNGLKDAYLRVMLSAGNETLSSWQRGEKLNLVLVARPLPAIPQEKYPQGFRSLISQKVQIVPDEFCQIKSTDYLRYMAARAEANQQNCDEALLNNIHGRLVEGASSNLFIYDGARWLTPPLSEGPLPGVTRRILLHILSQHRIPFAELPIPSKQIFRASEALLTSTLKEVMPLTWVDERAIGSGQVGVETKRLQSLFHKELLNRQKTYHLKDLIGTQSS